MAAHGSVSYLMMTKVPYKQPKVIAYHGRCIICGRSNETLASWYPAVYPEKKKEPRANAAPAAKG